MYGCVCVCLCQMCVHACPWRSEEGIRSLSARVTVIVSHKTWTLGLKLRSSRRATSTLNHTISLVPDNSSFRTTAPSNITALRAKSFCMDGLL